VMEDGMRVVIFIFGAVCGRELRSTVSEAFIDGSVSPGTLAYSRPAVNMEGLYKPFSPRHTRSTTSFGTE
jgi:hypothetical protein